MSMQGYAVAIPLAGGIGGSLLTANEIPTWLDPPPDSKTIPYLERLTQLVPLRYAQMTTASQTQKM